MPTSAAKPDAITWKPYAFDADGILPVAAMPHMTDGYEWAPLLGAGQRRLALRAFRLRENDKGKPIRETWTGDRCFQWPLEIAWVDPGADQPPESCCRLPGLPGWWLLHAEILAH